MTSIIHTTKWTCDWDGNWRRCGDADTEKMLDRASVPAKVAG